MDNLRQGSRRTSEQIREHYEIERRLADKLRSASKQERSHLYTQVYDELFISVPHHPQLLKKQQAKIIDGSANVYLALLKKLLSPKMIFMEIGPGDCRISFAVAKFVKKVYGIDVSSEITKRDDKPVNFELIVSDGASIAVPSNSVDVAFSNQLMEHLHPDDADEQLKNIYKSLNIGSLYLCITPNRLSGPHDVSQYFDNEARGLHLKEYTTRELAEKMLGIGFSRIRTFVVIKGHVIYVPLLFVSAGEMFLEFFPARLRRWFALHTPFRHLIGVNILAMKNS